VDSAQHAHSHQIVNSIPSLVRTGPRRTCLPRPDFPAQAPRARLPVARRPARAALLQAAAWVVP